MTQVNVEDLLIRADSVLSWTRNRQWPNDVQDEMDRVIIDIRAVLKEPHIAEFTDTGWSIQHPVSCRPNLQDCAIHKAVAEEVEFIGGAPVDERGRYIVTLGPNGPRYEP